MTLGTESLTKIWLTALVLIVAAVVWFVVRTLIRRWDARVRRNLETTGELSDRARAQRLGTIARTLATVAFIIVTVVASVTILGVWGVPLMPLIASFSVVGIAIGIGAQDLVKDVIAGMFILIEDQYARGDVVKLAGVSGTVEEIRLRTTVLRDLDGSIHHVPNGEPRVATNLTHEFSRLVIDLSIAYEESVDRAIDVIRSLAEGLATDPDWRELIIEDPRILGVERLADSGVVIRVLLTTDPDERWNVKREFLRRIKNGLDEQGIEIPYPHVTLARRGDHR